MTEEQRRFSEWLKSTDALVEETLGGIPPGRGTCGCRWRFGRGAWELEAACADHDGPGGKATPPPSGFSTVTAEQAAALRNFGWPPGPGDQAR